MRPGSDCENVYCELHDGHDGPHRNAHGVVDTTTNLPACRHTLERGCIECAELRVLARIERIIEDESRPMPPSTRRQLLAAIRQEGDDA